MKTFKFNSKSLFIALAFSFSLYKSNAQSPLKITETIENISAVVGRIDFTDPNSPAGSAELEIINNGADITLAFNIRMVLDGDHGHIILTSPLSNFNVPNPCGAGGNFNVNPSLITNSASAYDIQITPPATGFTAGCTLVVVLSLSTDINTFCHEYSQTGSPCFSGCPAVFTPNLHTLLQSQGPPCPIQDLVLSAYTALSNNISISPNNVFVSQYNLHFPKININRINLTDCGGNNTSLEVFEYNGATLDPYDGTEVNDNFFVQVPIENYGNDVTLDATDPIIKIESCHPTNFTLVELWYFDGLTFTQSTLTPVADAFTIDDVSLATFMADNSTLEANGEVLTVYLRYETSECPNRDWPGPLQGSIRAGWGNNTIFQWSDEGLFTVCPETDQPGIVVVGVTKNPEDFCYGQNNGSIYTMELRNTGNLGSDIVITFYNPSFLLNYTQYDDPDNNLNVIGAAFFDVIPLPSNNEFQVVFTAAAGGQYFITWPAPTYLPLPQNCGTSYLMDDWRYNIVFEDECGDDVPLYPNNDTPVIPSSRFGNNHLDVSAPFQVVDPDAQGPLLSAPFSAQFSNDNVISFWPSENNGPNKRIEVRILLPTSLAQGTLYPASYPVVGNNDVQVYLPTVNSGNVSVDPDFVNYNQLPCGDGLITLIYDLNNIANHPVLSETDFRNISVNVDLIATCCCSGTVNPQYNLTLQTLFYPDDIACLNCSLLVACGEAYINIQCPGCRRHGIHSLNYNAVRNNYGMPDVNNNGMADQAFQLALPAPLNFVPPYLNPTDPRYYPGIKTKRFTMHDELVGLYETEVKIDLSGNYHPLDVSNFPHTSTAGPCAASIAGFYYGYWKCDIIGQEDIFSYPGDPTDPNYSGPAFEMHMWGGCLPPNFDANNPYSITLQWRSNYDRVIYNPGTTTLIYNFSLDRLIAEAGPQPFELFTHGMHINFIHHLRVRTNLSTASPSINYIINNNACLSLRAETFSDPLMDPDDGAPYFTCFDPGHSVCNPEIDYDKVCTDGWIIYSPGRPDYNCDDIAWYCTKYGAMVNVRRWTFSIFYVSQENSSSCGFGFRNLNALRIGSPGCGGSTPNRDVFRYEYRNFMRPTEFRMYHDDDLRSTGVTRQPIYSSMPCNNTLSPAFGGNSPFILPIVGGTRIDYDAFHNLAAHDGFDPWNDWNLPDDGVYFEDIFGLGITSCNFHYQANQAGITTTPLDVRGVYQLPNELADEAIFQDASLIRVAPDRVEKIIYNGDRPIAQPILQIPPVTTQLTGVLNGTSDITFTINNAALCQDDDIFNDATNLWVAFLPSANCNTSQLFQVTQVEYSVDGGVSWTTVAANTNLGDIVNLGINLRECEDVRVRVTFDYDCSQGSECFQVVSGWGCPLIPAVTTVQEYTADNCQVVTAEMEVTYEAPSLHVSQVPVGHQSCSPYTYQFEIKNTGYGCIGDITANFNVGSTSCYTLNDVQSSIVYHLNTGGTAGSIGTGFTGAPNYSGNLLPFLGMGLGGINPNCGNTYITKIVLTVTFDIICPDCPIDVVIQMNGGCSRGNVFHTILYPVLDIANIAPPVVSCSRTDYKDICRGVITNEVIITAGGPIHGAFFPATFTYRITVPAGFHYVTSMPAATQCGPTCYEWVLPTNTNTFTLSYSLQADATTLCGHYAVPYEIIFSPDAHTYPCPFDPAICDPTQTIANGECDFDYQIPPVCFDPSTLTACPGATITFRTADHFCGFITVDYYGDGSVTCTSSAPFSNNDPCMSFTYNTPGNYLVTFTTAADINGVPGACTGTCSQMIHIVSSLDIDLGPDRLYCGPTTLDAGYDASWTYLWSTGETTEYITVTAPGTYTVAVNDITTKCGGTDEITLTRFQAYSSATSLLCNLDASGTATATAINGISPYTYLWNNGETTQTISNLPAGNYSCTVTDANGCTASVTAVVNEPDVLNITGYPLHVSCHGGNDGAATAGTQGGTPPYQYLWDNGATTQTITGLVAGTYTCTITDANGCVEEIGIQVLEPATLTVTGNSTSVLCHGGATGTASANPQGGTAPYTYLWNTAQVTQNLINLAAGSYTCTVTDGNQCTASSTITVTEPAAIILSTSTTDACPDNGTATANVTGGVTPYIYSWSTGATTAGITGLSAGNYTVTVTDANNCTGPSVAVVSLCCSPVITGPANICNGTSGILQVTNCTLNPGDQWKWYTSSCGGSNVGTGSSINVNPSSTTTYYLRSENLSGIATSLCVSHLLVVSPSVPSTPATIQGAGNFCLNTPHTFSTTSNNAVSYTWSVNNATATYTCNTSSCTMSFSQIGGGATVCVTASNACGTSSQRCNGIGNGITVLCCGINGQENCLCGLNNVTYTVTAGTHNPTSYTWSVVSVNPAGSVTLGGSITNSETASFSNSFVSCQLQVYATNICGNSVTRTLTLVGPPAKPGVISGVTPVCPGDINTYSTSGSSCNGATYNWTVPSGCSILSGQTSTSVSVQWGNNAGSVIVSASNNCGNSSGRSLSVSLSGSCRLGAGIDSEDQSNFQIIPNPSDGNFTMYLQSATSGNLAIIIRDFTGRLIIHQSEKIAEGDNHFVFDLGNLAKGIYYLDALTEGEKFRNKIVIQ